MKKIYTLFLVFFILGISFQTKAQNLIDNWELNGATGEGSDPGTAGWKGTPVVTWGTANQAVTIRFMDNPSGITYKGSAWTGRGLCIRWDGTGGSSINTVFAYPVTLEASKHYLFSGKIGWNSNGSGTAHIMTGINGSADNTGMTLDSSVMTIYAADKLKIFDDTLVFSPLTSGTYYLTFRCDNQIMGMIGDLSIKEITDDCIKDFNNQYNNLTLGDISKVTTNLVLPAGSGNVALSWTSANPAAITNEGVVTRPVKFSSQATLTAYMTSTCSGYKYQHYKSFNAIVEGLQPSPTEMLARWNFEPSSITTVNDTVNITDKSGNNLTGKVINEASIRTIGSSAKFNVLDLGNNKGYFDLGKEIGMAIYTLKDYTICAYFRVDTSYHQLSGNGNFLWTFSNREDQTSTTTRNGYIIGRLNTTGQDIVSTTNAGQSVKMGTSGTVAPQGGWHHLAYTQKGDSGKIYLDGTVVARGRITNLPFSALPKQGFSGTPFNWIGRSCFASDAYLRNTLVYDFQLYSAEVTSDDFKEFDVKGVIASLDAAYKEKSNDTLPELKTELKNLSLGDLSAVSSNLTLPSKGTDPLVTITWTSNIPAVISNSGVVNRRDYVNTPVVLTATLSKSGQKVFKNFNATILANAGTEFTSDLLLNYNFADNLVNGTTVKDAAEKQYAGTLKKGAAVLIMGPADNKQNVLKLYSDSAYFDMGTEIGKVIYNLSNYSVSVYFLIDKDKSNFSNDGNFIYTFSNSDSAGTAQNGYMFGRATRSTHCVSTNYWNKGNMATASASKEPTKGTFHHFAYTQNGFVGTSYLDGNVVSTVPSFTNIPVLAIAKEGRTGTLYNWLGRSNYVGDKYLSKALIANFSLYKKPLSASDIQALQDKRLKLNLAHIHDSVPELLTELAALDLGDLTKVTGDITLPRNGTLDPSIAISWKSSKTISVSDSGVVNRPDFIDSKVVLTATLSKDGQSITKDFPATVLANTGTGYTSDLLLNYNFADNMVNGTKVTDAAEKHFEGTLKNGAVVKAIGPAAGSKLNVLYLNTDTAYFDMGLDCGKLLYGLTDYSVSVFYLIQPSNTTLSNNGNIIYTFSNCDSAAVEKKGYMTGRATNAVHAVTSQYSEAGNMQTGASTGEPTKGEFHHLVFTQSGNVATTYLDGTAVSTVQNFTNLPSSVLPKKGMLGTQYNWLGKSPYQNETYLTKAMIADFKLYKKALTSAEITAMQTQRTDLNTKYTTPVHETTLEKVRVYSPLQGVITIEGLTGTEKISVTDLLGRSIAVKDPAAIFVKPGIYIVRINEWSAKVLVR